MKSLWLTPAIVEAQSGRRQLPKALIFVKFLSPVYTSNKAFEYGVLLPTALARRGQGIHGPQSSMVAECRVGLLFKQVRMFLKGS